MSCSGSGYGWIINRSGLRGGKAGTLKQKGKAKKSENQVHDPTQVPEKNRFQICLKAAKHRRTKYIHYPAAEYRVKKGT